MSTLLCEARQYSWGQNRALPAPLSAAKIIFADPPYNQAVQYADDSTQDFVSDSAYRNSCLKWLGDLSHLLAIGGTLWWLCPERHGDFMGAMLNEIIGPRVHRVIFEESFAQYQQGKLTEDYRFLFCHIKSNVDTDAEKWGKDLLTFNPDAIREMSIRQEMGDKRADPRGRVPGQVWKMRRLQGTSNDRVDWHPTQLPPELLRRIVRGWSNPGDLVIDAFAGSGNMGVVCQQEKRSFIGYDQSITYVDKMNQRFQERK